MAIASILVIQMVILIAILMLQTKVQGQYQAIGSELTSTPQQKILLAISGKLQYLMELAEELVPEGKRDKEECILLFESVLEQALSLLASGVPLRAWPSFFALRNA